MLLVKKTILLIMLLYSVVLYSQMPETDLWLFKLQKNKKTLLQKGVNITNRVGYDNQPAFSSDNKFIYYTSVKEDNQADIYAYKISNKKTKRITNTPESEYSPTQSPVSGALAVVSVLKDSSQVIQLLSPKTYSVMPSALSLIDSIGYYLFLNSDTVLYYKLTNPHSLRLYAISSGNDFFICHNPSRTFKTISRTAFVYGIKDSNSTAYFIYNTLLQKATLYAKMEGVNEDIYWHSQYGLLVANKSTILRYDESSKSWIVLFDLKEFGIQKITRFCFDKKNNYLVVVNNL